ncbi:MAG: hypothetical protein QN178_06175 [Armatimonadota bacterium]|nr:hypothetical protein [Armatimonadota bacterium]
MLLQAVAAHGFANLLGFGWLAAYVSLSGSPVATVSLGLLGGGALAAVEALGMINGSRLGASFIVLATGFAYYLRGGTRGRGVISMGILSMLTTATIYIPAMPLAVALLQAGWLDPVRFGSAAWTTSALDAAVGPVLRLIPPGIPTLMRFGAGYALLLVSFRLFDRALPRVDTGRLRHGHWGAWLAQPATMFALGLLVTSLTLSVSVSLSILVPLAARGIVGRTTVIPYIMGANITTFADTLFAALLIATPAAFTVVLAEMLAVTAVSLVVLLTMFGAYQRALLAANSAVAATKTRFALFVGALALAPLILLVL